MNLKVGTPSSAGILTETVGTINKEADRWLASDLHTGFVLLAARKGEIFFYESFGVHGPGENSPPLRKDALFPLASLSKPITATAAMILVEEGLLGLGRPLQGYIPEFKGNGKDKVIVHQLFTHTSGINDDDMFALAEIERETAEIPPPPETLSPKVSELLYFMLKTPLAKEPGKEMVYADTNYYLIGELVRRISGMSLTQFAQERIFDPMGMKDSYFIVPRDQQHRVVRRPDDVPGADFHSQERMERASPSSGVYSTALDMAKFGQMFLNGGSYGNNGILSPAAVETMTRNQIPGISADFLDTHFPEASWGLGWSIGHTYKGKIYGEQLPSPGYFGHGGYGGVDMWGDPDRDLVGVYFSVALKYDHNDFQVTNADLFMNMVTAGVIDDPALKRAGIGRRKELTEASGRDTATISGKELLEPSGGSRELRLGSPSEVGIDPSRIDRLVERARGWVSEGIHPSLVMLAARHGVIFLHEAIGRTGPGPEAPAIQTDAIFPLASITKPITAAAVMILVEEGKLGLNRPVREYLPDFQGNGTEKILVRQLLTHTSGLQEIDLLKLAAERGLIPNNEMNEENWAVIYSSEEALRKLLLDLEPSIPQDDVMVYAACNYDLLSELIARVSGESFSEFLHQRILQRLGMKNSFIPLPKQLRGRVVDRPVGAPFKRFFDAAMKHGLQTGGSSVYSTAADLAVFGQMFLNNGSYDGKRILSPASIAAMMRDQIPGLQPDYMGESIGPAEWSLGWSVHDKKRSWAYDEMLLAPGSISHGGAGGVFMWVDPSRDLVAIFLSTYLAFTEFETPVAATDLFINSLLASIAEIETT